jgi:hypothetical protein
VGVEILGLGAWLVSVGGGDELLLICIVRFWGLIIRSRERRLCVRSVSVKSEGSAISRQCEKWVTDGNDGRAGKGKGRDERLGASAFVPPTHPNPGWMEHPRPCLGEKKQRVRDARGLDFRLSDEG